MRGKKKRRDVGEFSIHLMDNIVALRQELLFKTYKHGPYDAFKINDPKPRDIHKANVRDRIVHHAIYRILYPYFDKKFIFDSFSCRNDKGTHRALNRFRDFAFKTSKNNTRTVWILKGDIKKFFASINHEILKGILKKHIIDKNILWLLDNVINSFNTEKRRGLGLPLGNVTSQLLINVYMNELDQYIKRRMKIRYYIRYADDFVIFDRDKLYLENLIPRISNYLENNLKLSLNQNKIFIKTLASGIDFLGWVNFSHHRILRTSTKRRMFKKLKQRSTKESVASYLGLLKHGNAYKLAKNVVGNIDRL